MPDVSQRDIEIRYSFTGAELLLFGAILYPDGRAPRERADIAVVIKGPVQPLVVREKQKVAGIWMNVESARFRSAPSFYAVASSRPLSELVDERTAAIYELGLQNLQLSPGTGASPETQRRFEAGLIDLQQRHQLYFEDPRGVEITDFVLYRARLRHSRAQVPVGNYTAETFLIQDGRVVAGAVRDIRIQQARLRALRRQGRRPLVLHLRPGRRAASPCCGWLRLGGQRLVPAQADLTAAGSD